MVLCFSAREKKPPLYDPAMEPAAKEYLKMMDEEFMRASQFSTWGPDGVHMPFVELLIGAWGVQREALVVDGTYTRAFKELVFATVSSANNCAFCSNSHSVCARSLGEREAVNFMKSKDLGAIADERARRVVEWALNALRPQTETSRRPPFGRAEAPELLGSAFMALYFNSIVVNFVSERALPPLVPGFLRSAYDRQGLVKTALDTLLALPMRKSDAKPGRMARIQQLLPAKYELDAVALPEDLGWVRPNKHLETNLKFWICVLKEVSGRMIPKAITEFVSEYVMGEYKGEALPEAPRTWAAKEVQRFRDRYEFGEENELWAQLLLLLAVEPAKAKESKLFEEFTKKHPGEEGQKELKISAIWAAFLRSRRVCAWLAEGLKDNKE